MLVKKQNEKTGVKAIVSSVYAALIFVVTVLFY